MILMLILHKSHHPYILYSDSYLNTHTWQEQFFVINVVGESTQVWLETNLFYKQKI